jgi:hypothetical protein
LNQLWQCLLSQSILLGDANELTVLVRETVSDDDIVCFLVVRINRSALAPVRTAETEANAFRLIIHTLKLTGVR